MWIHLLGQDIPFILQSGAGEGSHFSDQDYIKTGATIVYNAEEVYQRAELIVKVTPVKESEVDLLMENQILFSSLHLAVGKRDTINKITSKENYSSWI